MNARSQPSRTIIASADVRAGRFLKAQQFLRVANDARELAHDEDVGDAAVTLYVHAGIAAADALCARALGKYAQGSDHQHAIQLLASVAPEAANALKVLLSMKTRAAYGAEQVSPSALLRAQRSAQSLVLTATRQ